jgi:hypothetical protein
MGTRDNHLKGNTLAIMLASHVASVVENLEGKQWEKQPHRKYKYQKGKKLVM